MSLLELDDLTVLRGACPVVDAVSMAVGPGELVGLIGPNGAGKTTLMRGALGLLPCRGRSSLAAMAPGARARHAAWMPQAREIAWPVPVATLVALGRMPWAARGMTDTDRAAVDRALTALDLQAWRDRPATALSGGEQARVLLARALAQETPLLLADEPIAGLDPAHQLATMAHLAGLARAGRGIVVALHDLGLAARFCTRLVLLAGGRLCADGPPAAVLTPDLMRAAFGVRAWFADTPYGPLFQPVEVLA